MKDRQISQAEFLANGGNHNRLQYTTGSLAQGNLRYWTKAAR